MYVGLHKSRQQYAATGLNHFRVFVLTAGKRIADPADPPSFDIHITFEDIVSAVERDYCRTLDKKRFGHISYLERFEPVSADSDVLFNVYCMAGPPGVGRRWSLCDGTSLNRY
jgi:hypothetical protein